jgi:8-oxo-dGTP pyrophosphatase MutT (NUDIX family)
MPTISERQGELPAAAGVMLLDPEGHALFLRRSKEGDHCGEWCWPGGGVEPGETPDAAARREVEEETGHRIEGELSHADHTNESVSFDTFAHQLPQRFEPRLNDEHSEHVWADPKQPPEPLHPGVRATLEKLHGEAKDCGRPAMDASLAFDRSSVRTYDADKRLHVSSTPISKSNVCEYLGREIPGAEELGLDPSKRYRLWRHPAELAKAAPTFNNIPVLSRHVPVSAEDHKPEDVIGSTGTDAEFLKPYLKNSLVIWAKSAIDDVEREAKRELSSAYRYRADMTPGKTPDGEVFDGVMRDIVGNHVAIVQTGRAGHDVVVADSAEELMWARLEHALGAAFPGAMDAWKEEDHPRKGGKFVKKGGGESGTAKAGTTPKTVKTRSNVDAHVKAFEKNKAKEAKASEKAETKATHAKKITPKKATTGPDTPEAVPKTRKPTIYEALREKLGREPTNAELKQDVERIKSEGMMQAASQGKLGHQRKKPQAKAETKSKSTEPSSINSGTEAKKGVSSKQSNSGGSSVISEKQNPKKTDAPDVLKEDIATFRRRSNLGASAFGHAIAQKMGVKSGSLPNTLKAARAKYPDWKIFQAALEVYHANSVWAHGNTPEQLAAGREKAIAEFKKRSELAQSEVGRAAAKKSEAGQKEDKKPIKSRAAAPKEHKAPKTEKSAPDPFHAEIKKLARGASLNSSSFGKFLAEKLGIKPGPSLPKTVELARKKYSDAKIDESALAVFKEHTFRR